MLKLILTAIALAAGAIVPANAAPCRNAKGKFIKCDTAKPKPMKCRDAEGRFAKCGAAGTTPVK